LSSRSTTILIVAAQRRFLDWFDTGAYSCTGTCFDIGIQTRLALERYRRSGMALTGSEDPAASGNGAQMRLAPVAIRHWRDRVALARVADRQTRTTHGSPETLAASAAFATMLADAIEGVELGAIFSSPAAAAIEWRGLHRDAVEGTGYVVRSQQAAVWAVSRSNDFRSAVLLAANLGQDSDTTAAIAGQLAGAVYGAEGIPAEWLNAVAWRDRLATVAGRLFDAAWPEDDLGAEIATWMTQDWSLQERLEALAAFRPVFEREGFVFADEIPARADGDLIVLGGSSMGEETSRFYQMLYDNSWIRMFDWTTWRAGPAGERLMQDPAALAAASPDNLVRVLTTCVRADRFCEGYLADAFKAGLIGRVVIRAEALLRGM
jgi:ADP-ribosylglycohydrolase